MVLAPGPIFDAVEAVEASDGACRPLLALTPAGRRFDQSVARELAALDGFSLLCGRYEGIDQRVLDHCCDGELSIGDVVLAGGELAALVVIESVARLCEGVLGNDAEHASRRASPTDCSSTRSTPSRRAFRGWAGARGAALGRPRQGRALAPRRGPAHARSRAGPTSSRRAAGCAPTSTRCSTSSAPTSGAPNTSPGSGRPRGGPHRRRPRVPRSRPERGAPRRGARLACRSLRTERTPDAPDRAHRPRLAARRHPRRSAPATP